MDRYQSFGRRVLIACGHEQTRSFLTALLLDHGFEPEPAQDGPELLARLRHDPPAVVVLDFNGSGTAWLRRARHVAPDVPLVLVSNGQGLTPQEVAELADGYLDRPIRPDELLFTLCRLLRDPERGPADLSANRRKHAQRIELLGRLTGGVVHDLNNLVTVMLGHSELLLRTDLEANAIAEHASQIREAASRASSLTRRLLAFSRRETPRRVRLNLNVVIADMSRLLRSVLPTEIDVETHLDPTIENVEVDMGELEQLVMNLVLNARDAILEARGENGDRRGRVTLRTASELLGTEPAVLFSVMDNGCGMSATVRSRLFEPYFTTKPPGRGTGLGMGIVADIVEQCGGSIDVVSEVGLGTEFRIILPPAPHPIDLPRDARKLPNDSLHPNGVGELETILLVEDNDQVAGLTQAVLRNEGYHVLVASDGLEALEIGRAEPSVDLLLADLGLPGLNGIAIAEQLCADRPGLKVLFMSGEACPMEMAGEAHATPLLEKPFTPDDLVERVRQVLHQRGHLP